MSSETQITLVGNLTADPVLAFTPSGHAVANLSLASTPRKFNSDTKIWDDLPTAFWDVTVWRDYAEHVAATLQKGAAVIVQGVIRTESWEDKSTGKSRSKNVIDAIEIGATFRFATAVITKISSKPVPAV
jgi:single-strand DNA-binding protein